MDCFPQTHMCLCVRLYELVLALLGAETRYTQTESLPSSPFNVFSNPFQHFTRDASPADES